MKLFKSLFLASCLGLSQLSFSQTLIGESSLSVGGAIFEYNIPQNKFNITAKINPELEGETDAFKVSTCQSGDKFYGRTFRGGANTKGTIYEYDQAKKTIKVVYNFPKTEGTEFSITLSANNGFVYGAGTDEISGAYIFELNPATSKIQIFPAKDVNLGFTTFASLAANGKMYFMYKKLAQDNGTSYGMLEFDPATKTLTDKSSIASKGGFDPRSFSRMSDVGNGKLAATTSVMGSGPTIFVYDYVNNASKFIEIHKEGKYGESMGNVVSVSGKVYLFNRTGDKKKCTVYSVDLNSGKFVEEFAFSKLEIYDPFSCIVLGSKIYGYSLRGTKIFAYDTTAKNAVIVGDFKNQVDSLGDFVVSK